MLAARFLFLLLFGAALLLSASPAPLEQAPAPAPAAVRAVAAGPAAAAPADRKVVRAWGKLRITVKSGLHNHGGHQVVDPQDPSKVLIKAPRRFVPKPNSPTCPDGTDADHKGNCRAYW